MPPSDNARLVREYLETVWNEGRTDEADRFLAEDLAQHNPNLPDGRTPLVSFVDRMRASTPDARFELHRLAADGDLVFAHTRVSSGNGDRGMAVVDVFRIAGGRIVEHWDVKEPVPDSTASGRAVV